MTEYSWEGFQVNPQITHLGIRLNYAMDVTDFIFGLRCYVQGKPFEIQAKLLWNEGNQGGPPFTVIKNLWRPTLNNSQGFVSACGVRGRKEAFVFPDEFTVPEAASLRDDKISYVEPDITYLVCGTVLGIHNAVCVCGWAAPREIPVSPGRILDLS